MEWSANRRELVRFLPRYARPAVNAAFAGATCRCLLASRGCHQRVSRLTNGFSKKVENMSAAVALHFMYYNFCRIHQTLRVTPAMEAKVTDRLWDVQDLVQLLDAVPSN